MISLKFLINSIFTSYFFFILTSCNDSPGIIFAYSGHINDSVNIYIYHKTTFAHEGDESYFAIGSSFCDVYKNENKTFAETIGFAQIDTIISGKVYLSTQFKIVFHSTPKDLSFDIKEHKPMDRVRPDLEYAFIKADSCK